MPLQQKRLLSRGPHERAKEKDSLDGANTTVGREDDDRGKRGFEGAVEVGEALDIEHVHLVHKQHARDQLGNALVDVAVDDLVDLATQLEVH